MNFVVFFLAKEPEGGWVRFWMCHCWGGTLNFVVFFLAKEPEGVCLEKMCDTGSLMR